MQKVLSSLYKSYKQKWFYNLVSTKFGVPKMIYLCNNASCINIRIHSHCVKSVQMRKYGFFSGPYFPVFGLNTEIYGLNLRIQSEYWKIRTRKNFVFGHVLRNEFCQSIRSIWKNEASK